MSKRLLDPGEQFAGGVQRGEDIGDALSPYLRSDEAARFLRFDNPRLFREWATRNRVPVLRRGRTLLYDKRVLTAFIEGRTWTRRRVQ